MKEGLIFTIAKYFLTLQMIVFGANKLLGFLDVPPPEGETAQLFMGAMFGTYLAKSVAATEILGGILLLVPRISFIGFLLLLPIVANIVGYHVAHDFPGNGIWISTLILTGILVFNFRNKFTQLVIN